ncbi:MAG: urease accessory protein UreD [Pseudomonadota bacterium]
MNVVARIGPVLDIEVTGTRFHRHHVRFPWSLGRAYLSNGGYRVIPQVAGAGLLSGDRLSQRVRLGAGARLRLESAGAMLVLSGSGPARSDWFFDLGPGSRLILDAEPYALAPQAALQTKTRIRLAPGAQMIATEAVCHSHDCTRSFGAWQTQTRVETADGAQVLMDRQEATSEATQRLTQLPLAPSAFATIWVLGPSIWSKSLVQDLPSVEHPIAVTPLRANNGHAIRMVAPDGGSLRAAIRQLLSVLEARLDHSAGSIRAGTCTI